MNAFRRQNSSLGGWPYSPGKVLAKIGQTRSEQVDFRHYLSAGMDRHRTWPAGGCGEDRTGLHGDDL